MYWEIKPDSDSGRERGRDELDEYTAAVEDAWGIEHAPPNEEPPLQEGDEFSGTLEVSTTAGSGRTFELSWASDPDRTGLILYSWRIRDTDSDPWRDITYDEMKAYAGEVQSMIDASEGAGSFLHRTERILEPLIEAIGGAAVGQQASGARPTSPQPLSPSPYRTAPRGLSPGSQVPSSPPPQSVPAPPP